MRVSPILIGLVVARLLLYLLTNGQYGFHRDELQTLADAHHPDWGYVVYPPVTPVLARVGIELFGATPAGLRVLTAVAQALAMLLTGLIAKELGGAAWAQCIAALAVFASPVSLTAGHLFEYVSFDYLWSVCVVYFVVKLLRTEDRRWWLPVGAAVGLGFLTKYTMAWLVAALFVGLVATPARRLLRSWYLAGAVGIAFLMVLPNVVWQVQHGFLSLDFLRAIHARDIAQGRTDGFLLRQFLVPANPFSIPLWVTGLVVLIRGKRWSRYRALAWAFFVAMALFATAQARDYYTAPLYPILLAAGAVAASQWGRWARGMVAVGLMVGITLGVAFLLPVAPAGSEWFRRAMETNGDLREEIGWEELVARVAVIRDGLPEPERSAAGIFASNYGEAGAIDHFGGKYGLPPAISGVNSYWTRLQGSALPATMIVIGVEQKDVERAFAACEAHGDITNRYGVVNEESAKRGALWVCRGLRPTREQFWRAVRSWG